MVWLLSLRDLQWRRRRFAIGVVATGLVFGLSLLLTGVSAGFGGEASRVVGWFGASQWLVRSGGLGPFTGPVAFAQRIASGVGDPILVGRANTSQDREVQVVGVAGHFAGPAQALVDAHVPVRPGQSLVLNGHRFRVVGVARQDMTIFGGTPVVFIPLADAQQMFFGGAAMATAVVVHGRVSAVSSGFHVLTNAQVRADMMRPVQPARQTIGLVNVLLWVAAAGIVGAIIYLSALERGRDFAVLKAVGVPDRVVIGGLVLQSVLLALVAVGVAVGLETAMAPMSSMPAELSPAGYLTLPVIGLAVGILASSLAARRARRVDPALAFAGP